MTRRPGRGPTPTASSEAGMAADAGVRNTKLPNQHARRGSAAREVSTVVVRETALAAARRATKEPWLDGLSQIKDHVNVNEHLILQKSGRHLQAGLRHRQPSENRILFRARRPCRELE